MIRTFSERQMRRRMGKSARQWKKLRKAERRGSSLTAAKRGRIGRRNLEALAERWHRIAADDYPRSARADRSRRVSAAFQCHPIGGGLRA